VIVRTGTYQNIRSTAAVALVAAAVVTFTVGCSNPKFDVSQGKQEFGQEATYNTQVDVLFVVDSSSSMGPRQSALSNEVPTFISMLDQTGLDYHIAVTSMDMDNGGAQGQFVSQAGTSKVLTRGMPDLVPMLAQRIRLGNTGSRIEQGLASMKSALSPSLLSGFNAGFLRPQALLAVVFLSDENDQSPTDNYISFLNTLRPKLSSGETSWLAHFIGVVPNDTNCTSAEWQFFSPGLKYMELATASGGVAESICKADLSDAVTNMRARLLEVITEYRLAGFPKVDSIVVTVDGVVVPKDALNGWTYHKDINSVRFHGRAIPKPNSKIRVDFSPEKLQ
jgi:hypothetical protein